MKMNRYLKLFVALFIVLSLASCQNSDNEQPVSWKVYSDLNTTYEDGTSGNYIEIFSIQYNDQYLDVYGNFNTDIYEDMILICQIEGETLNDDFSFDFAKTVSENDLTPIVFDSDNNYQLARIDRIGHLYYNFPQEAYESIQNNQVISCNIYFEYIAFALDLTNNSI